jgi:hypothetical protein
MVLGGSSILGSFSTLGRDAFIGVSGFFGLSDALIWVGVTLGVLVGTRGRGAPISKIRRFKDSVADFAESDDGGGGVHGAVSYLPGAGVPTSNFEGHESSF